MRTLLSATLAVLLVAAVTAQSSKQDASSAQALFEKVTHVVDSLGGLEGTINKLTYISGLVQKAYTDDGIGGWMARNLIKMELNHLKNQAMEKEKAIINHLVDELETKFGIKSSTYENVAENYIFSEAVKKAIAFIRQSISEIVAEIGQAQKEHDEAAGKISDSAMAKLNEHLAALREKLRGLGKKLLDKLTGRDKTAEVYGEDAGLRYGEDAGLRYGEDAGLRYGDNGGIRYGDNGGIRYGDNGGIRYGGIRYEMIEAPSDTYIIGEAVKVAIQQIRERIFKYIEMMGEAKRQIQKELGKHKELAMKHLETLKQLLQKAMADLRDALLGRKSADDLNKEIEEEDKKMEEIEEENKEINEQLYAVQLMSSENYVLDEVIKELIGKLRTKMFEIIKQIGEAKREAQKATKEAKEVAMEHLAKLQEQLSKLWRDLRDSLAGKKTADEIEKDLE